MLLKRRKEEDLKRSEGVIASNTRNVEVSEEITSDRVKWKCRIRVTDPN